MARNPRHKFAWTGHVESLEERLAMSADPLMTPISQFDDVAIEHLTTSVEEDFPIDHHLSADPDFWLDEEALAAIDAELQGIEQFLANAHNQTGLTGVRNNYGFTGVGQTVAVIDSGIAYDHIALGGGFGSNYRVVGGWDFTGENDANPYDDGPSGSHGTHVAGIIGADLGSNTGVAPDADLVALRVFDDAGNGYFSWVEKALQWVHNNRNNFENPITAINLSLGDPSWNASTVPNWANLEDEFAQLEADGIFIAVAAGNSYQSFNTAGLSYPGASQYVVPVMSVNDSGNLSSFSQRHTRAIAAPGQGIVSTVPDYKGNNNDIADDYASYSGTSMASPYLAGASVIIREAMEFVGYTSITQDMIYDHIVDTADAFFDSSSNAWYNRLNLGAAIDALMPDDDFGSTTVTAYNLGTLSGDMAMNGTIGTIDDADYFKFTAAASGTATFTASNMTHNLASTWMGSGNWSGAQNETFSFDVVAGQSYTVGLGTQDGIGYYNLDISLEASFSYTDWGAISFNQVNDQSIAGETWYRVQASQSGYVTVEGMFNVGGGQVNLELYNSNLQLVTSGNGTNGAARVDAYVSAGTELFVKVVGTNADVDFRLTNLVSVSGTVVEVDGTAGNDVFSFNAGATHVVTVNAVSYSFTAVSVTEVHFYGGTGTDSIKMTGTAGDETATLKVGSAELVGAGYKAITASVENAELRGGGGNDVAVFRDSAGDDQYRGWSNRAYMSGSGFFNDTYDFDHTVAFANAGGNDFAIFYDAAGDDVYAAWSTRAYMIGTGYFNDTYGFERTIANSSAGGIDRAVFYDSAGDDTYVGWSYRAYMTGNGFFNDAYGFRRTVAQSTAGGNDRAVLYDTPGNDQYRVWWDRAYMTGTDYFNDARGFHRTTAHSTAGGYDAALFYDTAGNDEYRVWSDHAYMIGNNYFNEISGFDRTTALATAGGYDTVLFYDTPGNDVYVAWSTRAYMAGTGYMNDTYGFDRTTALATAGGYDRAVFHDTVDNDVFVSWAHRSYMGGTGYLNNAWGFDRVAANSVAGGTDRAILYDSLGDDDIRVRDWGASVTSLQHYCEALGFVQITGQMINGGNNLVDAEAVDYVFGLVGTWT